MAYAGLIILLAILLFITWAIGSYLANKPVKEIPAVSARTPKALEAGSKSVRLLDQILTDPTLIGSPRWKEEAQSTVNEWYGE